MMLIAIGSDKGSPGATSAAVVLASAWHTGCIVVEVDPGGGDLGLRLRPDGVPLPEAPTVLSLSAAARTDAAPDLVARHAQRLNDVAAVVPGAVRAEQMAKLGDWAALSDALRRPEGAIVVDVGRIHAGSPAFAIMAEADVVVVSARPDLVSVLRMRDRLASLAVTLSTARGAPVRLFPLLIVPSRSGGHLLDDLFGLISQSAAHPFVIGAGLLAEDRPALKRIEDGHDPAGRLARSNLMRTGREVVGQLEAALHEHQVGGVTRG